VTIDLCFFFSRGPGFARLDLRGSIPVVVIITHGKVHDVNKILDRLVFEAGAFYVMDRGYLDSPGFTKYIWHLEFLSPGPNVLP
jgi:hypothetical protein